MCPFPCCSISKHRDLTRFATQRIPCIRFLSRRSILLSLQLNVQDLTMTTRPRSRSRSACSTCLTVCIPSSTLLCCCGCFFGQSSSSSSSCCCVAAVCSSSSLLRGVGVAVLAVFRSVVVVVVLLCCCRLLVVVSVARVVVAVLLSLHICDSKLEKQVSLGVQAYMYQFFVLQLQLNAV